ncbi:MAG: hypothetical protein IT379_39420 [Deltaproteobacteria bacterium]|nr:hypothetical protein [Deltaproteobacteria bacterium]
MADLDNYEGPGEVYANGRLIAEARNVRVTTTTNDREVTTMTKGLAGFSKGPTRSEASIEQAVPKAGFPVDWEEITIARTPIRLVVVHGGKRRTHVGRFTQYEASNSVDDAASANLSFVGKPRGST